MTQIPYHLLDKGDEDSVTKWNLWMALRNNQLNTSRVKGSNLILQYFPFPKESIDFAFDFSTTLFTDVFFLGWTTQLNITLSDIHESIFDSSKIDRSRISYSSLVNIICDNITVSNTEIYACDIRGLEIKDATIENTSFDDCTVTNCKFINSLFNDCFLFEGDSHVSNSDFSYSKFNSTHISGVSKDDTLLEVLNCNFKGCKFIDGSISNSNFINCNFTESEFLTDTGSYDDMRVPFKLEGVTFIDCNFSGVVNVERDVMNGVKFMGNTIYDSFTNDEITKRINS